MFDLTGKTALVTGATGGIGGAIARAPARPGRRRGRSPARATAALEALAGELGERATVPRAISREPAAVDGLVAEAEAAGAARLDILVANAGVTRDGLLVRMKDEDWDAVIKVNLEAISASRARRCAA